MTSIADEVLDLVVVNVTVHVCLAGLDLLFRFVSISEYWGCELTASPRTSQTYKGVSYLLSVSPFSPVGETTKYFL